MNLLKGKSIKWNTLMVINKANASALKAGAMLGMLSPLLLAFIGAANAAVSIDSSPLLVSKGVEPNIIFAIDNSGSMDSEVLFPTNDGAAWWNATNKSFVGLDQNDDSNPGVLNFNKAGNSSSTWKKYVYLFPNGIGTGSRVYGDSTNDHFALPPTPPYAWARSSAYNPIYYNDTETYQPWINTSKYTFSDADTSCTPSDPVSSGNCISLFSQFDSGSANWNSSNWRFTYENGMVKADGSPVSSQVNVATSYYPATFYGKVSTGSYGGNNGQLYSCSSVDPAGYTWFVSQWRKNPTSTNILPSGIDAIGPDGGCLKKYEIKSTVSFPSGRTFSEEQKNFANWFEYYRKRHLTLRGGVGQALNGFNNIRVGSFTINDLKAPTMNNIDTDKNGILDGFYAIGGHNGGTPNRQAVNYAGEQFKTNTNIIQYACQKNATILFTDGFSNVDTSSGVGNVDGDSNNTYFGKAPYSDSYSNTLADIAAYYYGNNLRTDLVTGDVPTPYECSDPNPDAWLDCNDNIHMNFFGVIMGAKGNLFGKSYFTTQDAYKTPPTWQPPTENRNPVQVDDLYHATINGRGGLYDARTPSELRNSLIDALSTFVNQVGTGASLAANSTQLKTGTVTYQANYYTGKWKGDLKAFAVDPTNGAVSTTATWSAASALPSAANRNIWTYNPDGKNSNSQYLAFQNSGTTSPPALSSAELSALSTDGTDVTDPATIVNYLRGDDTLEIKNNGTFRNRDTPLGDIVNSQPLYVGSPDSNLFTNQTFTGADKYAAFAVTEASRAGTVYVAANDGMLHAFDAITGKEIYAYLPAAVITHGLSALANKDYGTTTAVPHQFFNDGEMTVADIFAGNAWKTILVGTTGRGKAKAIYALNVTDPAKIQFLWERSAGDSHSNADSIGQMTGKPVIAQTADKQWQVLIGNGYNSLNDQAELLAFNLTNTSGQLDTSGTLTVYATDGSQNNGLAAPAIWIDNPSNGLATEAYAGDLLGHVWKFDLTNPGSAGQLLFTAKDSGGTVQPITAGLLLGKDPTTNNVWAFFGTGKYLAAFPDLADMNTQTWYGIIVANGTGQPSSLVTNLTNGRSALVQRIIVAEVPATSGDPSANPPVLPSFGKRAFTPKPSSNDMTAKSGWYIDLTSPIHPSEGERMVTPNQFQGSLLLGTSRIPQASDVCNPTGRGWIMAIDPFTGTNPSSTFFDTNGDGKFDKADLVELPDGTKLPAGGLGFSSLPNNPIFTGNTMLVSFDNGTTSSIATQGSVGALNRVSWREIVNQ